MLTPQPQAKKLAQALGLKTGLYLKREDLHPHGSHKGRSIPVMIAMYSKLGWMNFCISSSGNAALAAIYAIKADKNLSLYIFVGRHIPKDKLEMLKLASGGNKKIIIEQVDRPKQTAFQMDKKGKAKNLRQSTDDSALIGYEALAGELAEIKNLAAVFIPTSSGAMAQGLYNGFKKHNLNPQIHIVQTPACHPFIDSPITGPSAANAIVDKIGLRKEGVLKTLKDSGGRGWIVFDEEIHDIKRKLFDINETELANISANSALSIAGLAQAIKNNWRFNGPVVCLITGR